MSEMEAKNFAVEDQGEITRKGYQKPILTEYGTLAKLTQGGGGTGGEGAAMTMTPCL